MNNDLSFPILQTDTPGLEGSQARGAGETPRTLPGPALADGRDAPVPRVPSYAQCSREAGTVSQAYKDTEAQRAITHIRERRGLFCLSRSVSISYCLPSASELGGDRARLAPEGTVAAAVTRACIY